MTVLGLDTLTAAAARRPCVSRGRRAWRAVTLRGERTLGSVALGTSALLLAVMGACGWWSATVARDAAAAAKGEQIRTIGVTLAPRIAGLLAAGDAAGVRRVIVESAADFGLSPCRVTLGAAVGSVADVDPAVPTLRAVPANWSAGPADPSAEPTVARFPVIVPGRGLATLEIGGQPRGANQLFWRVQTGVGLIGAAALASVLLAYRRTRVRLAGTEAVVGALAAYAGGERSTDAMTIDPTLGTVAAAWNDVMAAVDRSARASVATRAAAGVRGVEQRRQGDTSELEVACGVITQGLLLVDEDLRVRFANGAAAVFVGKGRDECVGRTAAELIGDPAVLEPLRTLATRTTRSSVTVESERPAGPGTVGSTLRFTIRPFRKDDEAACLITIDDITSQRAAERARNSFVEQVTHELRTPLTTIRLYTETAIETGASADAESAAMRANCLNVINVESRRLERIVGEMLSIAEIEAGSLTIRRDEVRLPELFEELRSDYAAQATDKELTLEMALPPKLPTILADRDKLAIAYHNLIGNALKYTPAGGKVTVAVQVVADVLTVAVQDSGIGIAPEEQDRVFERFYRSTDPRVGEIVGTGLGLPLAREIVRQHGGDITLDSQLNKGSTFTATVPIRGDA